jgi:threonine dehydrogenase-like Zn-dependent dehydrogenase
MRAVRISNKQGLIFDSDSPTPPTVVGESLIKVNLAGICSTDLEITKGYFGFEGILGHEFVGVVEQSDQPQWTGRRVVATINFADPHSAEFAEFGLEHHPSRQVMGILARDGAMADYVAVPTRNLLAVPDEVSDEQAVFTEPLAAALRIAEQIRLPPNQAVAVIGPGRLGMLVGQVVGLGGAPVTMLGRNPQSLRLAHSLGLDVALVDSVPQNQFHIVVDCTGSPQGLQQALRLTRPRGTIVLKSTYQELAPISLTKAVVDEIQIIGSRCGPFAPALRLLQTEQVQVRPLIDAYYPIEQALAAFAHAARDGVRKVLLQL